MIDQVQSINSQEMRSTDFIDEIWNTLYVLLKEGVLSIFI